MGELATLKGILCDVTAKGPARGVEVAPAVVGPCWLEAAGKKNGVRFSLFERHCCKPLKAAKC